MLWFLAGDLTWDSFRFNILTKPKVNNNPNSTRKRPVIIAPNLGAPFHIRTLAATNEQNAIIPIATRYDIFNFLFEVISLIV